MRRDDFRTVDDNIRSSYRQKAIRLIKKGKPKGEIAVLFGVNKNTVSNWCKSYEQNGKAGFKSKKKGAKSEDMKLLSSVQEQTIQKLMTNTMPEQYKLNYGLWTRKAVKELIAQTFGITLGITTTGDYLRRWGFSPQKPKKKAYEQNPKKVKQWLKHDYPRIKERAKTEGATIHWGDETGVKQSSHHGRSYAPIGKTPVKKSMSKHFSLHMVSTVTNQGKVQFMIYSEPMNAERFVIFLTMLVKVSDKKIFLILDNLSVHHSNIVAKWVEDHKDQIELFYLPAYSPEKNPDEYLNCDLKQGLSDKPAPKTIEKLKEQLENHMQLLQQNPQRVKKYFIHKDIKYAA
jgi:transposase